MPVEPVNNEPQPPVMVSPVAPLPINGQKSGLSFQKKHVKKITSRIGAMVAVAVIGSSLAAWLWYGVQLTPLAKNKEQLIEVTVEPGSTPSQIGQLLQDKSVIRSAFAFDVSTRLSGIRGKLQAGTYRLSPGQSTPQIVDHLVSGKVDQFTITFLPGGTLKQHIKVLLNAGFRQSEIDAALSQSYDAPQFKGLFEGKPAGTNLEGYIYGETYNFNTGSSVAEILQRTFTEFYAALSKNNLIDTIKQRDLTLYQAITLASIVQREVPKSADQKQVAQVFYSRLSASMTLGSDVTYQYAADKLGVARDVNLDSPYNTRRYPGLPPGPIASPGLTALKAVAAPAAGNYLYFLSGDDNVTYFAQTEAEHKTNISNHCVVKCNTL